MRGRLSLLAGWLLDRSEPLRRTGSESERVVVTPPIWVPLPPRVQLVGPTDQRAALLASAVGRALATAGLEIWGVHGSGTAWRWLEETGPTPDAVVVEIDDHLEKSGGAGLLGRVAPWLVIVVLTPTADTGLLAAALDAGADDALPVSAHPAEIAARVAAHLRRHGFQRCTSAPTSA